MKTNPRIYVMIPPPLYKDGAFSMTADVINNKLPAMITEIAKNMGLESNAIINQYEVGGGAAMTKPQLFADGCHPNDEGYFAMAEAVALALEHPFEVPQTKRNWISHLGHSEHMYYLQCVGDQEEKVMSHAHGKTSIVDNVGGEGEAFQVIIEEFPF